MKTKAVRIETRIVLFCLSGMIVAFFAAACSRSDSGSTIQTGTMQDIDGNSYQTVVIGSQTWMAENLKTIRLNDGTPIPLVTDANLWSTITSQARCFYNNDSSTFKAKHGALYNWYTVRTNKLCPTGWHVPSNEEWLALNSSLGVDSLSGGKLKGLVIWQSPNTYATNSSGFSALPSGYRFYNGSFNNVWISGNWWSSSEYSALSARYIYLSCTSGAMGRNFTDKLYGMSVRCIKD